MIQEQLHEAILACSISTLSPLLKPVSNEILITYTSEFDILLVEDEMNKLILVTKMTKVL
ncbi:hypothetical protein L873DRAFT_1813872 [Choiromyces venosus 120613-1]|uniref:Uncharacterized protein n=1 Tax=Choiromyces venosus 120613-1 TaxID=1336337 RepID=A0A3N4JC14_9PEZI|nr:hypothetical protein L873DRAFT_1813872 [Choiromyces venosus 120613-1]